MKPLPNREPHAQAVKQKPRADAGPASTGSRSSLPLRALFGDLSTTKKPEKLGGSSFGLRGVQCPGWSLAWLSSWFCFGWVFGCFSVRLGRASD